MGIGVPADGGGTEQPGPGRYRGPRHDLLAALRAHRSGLAGEDRLVDLETLTGDDLSVSGHLLAGAETYDVVEDDLADGHLLLGPIPQDYRSGSLQDGQTVQGALGADLRQGAGGGVEQQDESEQRVRPVPQCQDEDQRNAEDPVEDREDVGP